MNRFILLLFVAISAMSWGQQTTNVFTPTITCKSADKSGEWVEYVSNSQVTIEYKFVNCDPEIGFDQEQVLLRMTNHTGDELKLDWHVLLEYNQICKTCDYPEEYGYHIFLKPNETKEGSCSVYSENLEFRMFSKFLDDRARDKDELSSFTLSDLIVTAYPQD